MVRHNLTVTLDGNPVTGESKPIFHGSLRINEVEVVSSLHYEAYFTVNNEGPEFFQKSIGIHASFER